MSIGLGLGIRLGGRAASGPPAYVPATLAHCVLALDAGKGGFLTDQSGNGANFTAFGAPSVNATAAPNSKPALQLDGATQYTALSKSIALGAGFSVVVIGKLYSTSGANTGVFSAADAGNDYNSANGLLTWGAGSNAGAPSGLNSIVATINSTNLTLAMDTWYAISLEVAPTTDAVTLTANGVSQAFGGTGITDSVTPTVWSFGSRVLFGAAGTTLAKCDLAAAYVYSQKLSAPDRATLATFVNTTWGLTL